MSLDSYITELEKRQSLATYEEPFKQWALMNLRSPHAVSEKDFHRGFLAGRDVYQDEFPKIICVLRILLDVVEVYEGVRRVGFGAVKSNYAEKKLELIERILVGGE